MKFRFVFWDVLPCKIIAALMMEAECTSETSVDNYFTRQYIPENKSELQKLISITSPSSLDRADLHHWMCGPVMEIISVRMSTTL
jgi:hypothetical protein